MKKRYFFVLGIIAIVLCLSFVISKCIGGEGESDGKAVVIPETVYTPENLNISIFLDLSDRLVRDLTPNQTYRDTAIVGYLVDYFKKSTLGPNILKSENKMKVFFYPTPNSSEIVTLAQGLNVDIAELKGVAKRQALESMKATFSQNLKQIYDETLSAQNWVGCDIWDFFNNKKVDNLCMKQNARNILVILTDGYIYHKNNVQQNGHEYSYILPRNLNDSELSLIVKREGNLDNLEVLMLEINPTQASHRDHMVNVLEDWYRKLGVKHFVVAETDANMTNTQTIIKTFLEYKQE